MQKRIPFINIKCHINFRIDLFLTTYVGTGVSRLEPKKVETGMIKYLRQSDSCLNDQVSQLLIHYQGLESRLRGGCLQI